MGTRSLTVFLDEWNGSEIVVMYKQFDGYPEGYGLDLANYLKDFNVVNGISLAETRKIANGMSCLAAQVIANFKDGPGEFYLHPAGTRDCGEEYIYIVYANEDSNISIKCYDVYEEKQLFDIPANEYTEVLKTLP